MPGSITSATSVEVALPPGTTIDIINLLAVGVGTSTFEGLIPRPLESVGTPSLFSSQSTVQFIISTLLINLMAAGGA